MSHYQLVGRPNTTALVDADGCMIGELPALKYQHLYRATIGDGNAVAVEVNLFRLVPPGPGATAAPTLR
jgi:hypothetical protein